MDEISRILGKLEGFMDDTDRRLGKIERRIDTLSSFRWKLMGVVAGFGGIILIVRVVDAIGIK